MAGSQNAQLILGAIVGAILGVLASAVVAFWWEPRYGWLALPLLLGALGFLLLILFLVWLEKPSKPLWKLASGAVAIVLFLLGYYVVFSPESLSVQAVEPDVALSGEEIRVTVSGFDTEQRDAYDVRFDSVSLGFEVEKVTLDEVTLALRLPNLTPPDENELSAFLELTGPWPREVTTTIRLLGRPVVDSISPLEGYRTKGDEDGTRIEIVGKNFRLAKTRVFVGPSESRAVEVTDSEHIAATVPNLPESGRSYDVRVRVGKVDPNRGVFYVLGQPKISSIEPTEGFAATDASCGTRIAISGSDLLSKHEIGRTKIRLGEAAVSDIVTVDTDIAEEKHLSVVLLRVPRNARSGLVTVSTPEGDTTHFDEIKIVTEKPKIDWIDPLAQFAGRPIQIKGRNFDCNDATHNTIWFGPVSAKAFSCEGSLSEATLGVAVPTDAQDAPLHVATPAGASGPQAILRQAMDQARVPDRHGPGRLDHHRGIRIQRKYTCSFSRRSRKS